MLRELDVVTVHPRARRLRRDELEAQRAHPPAPRARDGVDVGARDPEGRMRRLVGLGHDVARGELPEPPLELHRGAREHRHQRAHGLFPLLALVAHARAERVQLDRALRLPQSQLHAAAREDVEHRRALGHADRMAGRQLHDAVAEPDLRRALARGAQEHLGRRHVRVLLEKVMLDDPRIVIAEPVGELDLGEHVRKQAVLALVRPRSRQLRLVEDAELHLGPITPSVRTIAARSPASFRMSPELGSTVRALPSYSTSSSFSLTT